MMNRKRFAWRGVGPLREIPRKEFRDADVRDARRYQRGQMQRLADVTGRVASAVFMVVKIRAAGGKVQKCNSGQQGQRTTRVHSDENALHQSLSTSRVHFTVSA